MTAKTGYVLEDNFSLKKKKKSRTFYSSMNYVMPFHVILNETRDIFYYNA